MIMGTVPCGMAAARCIPNAVTAAATKPSAEKMAVATCLAWSTASGVELIRGNRPRSESATVVRPNSGARAARS